MKSLLERLAAGEILISDGAMGTLLQAKGMAPGECPESWCVSHPDVVRCIAEAYLAAGSDIVETNSFGGTALRLKHYGLEGKVREFNRAPATLPTEASPRYRKVESKERFPLSHTAYYGGGLLSNFCATLTLTLVQNVGQATGDEGVRQSKTEARLTLLA